MEIYNNSIGSAKFKLAKEAIINFKHTIFMD